MIDIFKGVVIKIEGEYIVTQGLNQHIDYEIKVLNDNFNIEDSVYGLKYIIDYINKQNIKIFAEQTIAFNSWILKLVANGNDYLELYELNYDNSKFVKGLKYSSSVTKSQVQICEKYSSKLFFPMIHQKVVISDGVLTDGYAVEAVRYPSPDHMSGWWITTDLYNKDIKSLKQIAVSDLNLKRPDLMQYLALNNGFRFFISGNTEEAYFDEEVLNS